MNLSGESPPFLFISIWSLMLGYLMYIYVVDSLDRKRIVKAKAEFQTIIKDPFMLNAVILVFAHKQDKVFLVRCKIFSWLEDICMTRKQIKKMSSTFLRTNLPNLICFLTHWLQRSLSILDTTSH